VTDTKNETKCPRCGERASGNFCPGCGGALGAQDCASCNKPLTPGARFCHHCGATAGAGAAANAAGGRMPPTWAIVASVLVVLAAFVAGQKFGGGGGTPASGTVADAGGAPFAGGASRAPDISNMSPEEAANRLFDRVMRYATEGKPDSAAMFAPMAIMAYERIGPLDAHSRYDIGTISAVIGDAPIAAAQADTILKAQPNHLLGLLLAARAADLGKKPADAAKFRSRFAAAAAAEKAKNLREYTDHQREIDEALSKPAAKAP
jgi:hypothetical protein